ncbi:hypothetical protein PInf_006406 [Phytophthora infestans]|nr:hypothetical protein PInf_006406 [Phytophthora infestans]
MAKLSGSTNYKLSEVRRLLSLVEHYLRLGKDEWERLANSHNSNRGRVVAERDYESLRRKFMVLYTARKPTASDDKASVVDIDDGADVDQEEEEECQQDPSFGFEGEEGLGYNLPMYSEADTGDSNATDDPI